MTTSFTNVRNLGEKGVEFKVTGKKSGSTEAFKLPILGAHNAVNASLAVAVGCLMGISMPLAAQALLEVKSPGGRLSLSTGNGITIIDDTYNAGPDSIKAAIDTLSATAGNRKIAILSDILELGILEEEGHTEIGHYVAAKGIHILFAIGERAKYYAKGALDENTNMRVVYYDTKEHAFSDIVSTIETGDVILVKGSNATRISELARALKEAVGGKEVSR